VRQCSVVGADLVLAPTALSIDWPVVSRCLIPSRAFENTVFLAYANYAGQDQSDSYIGDGSHFKEEPFSNCT
jgi:predicted amidohydrolase